MLCALAGGLAPVAAAQAAPPTVAYTVAVVPRSNGASLVLELSEETAYDVTVLSKPDRIIIDLPKVAFASSGGKPSGKVGPVSAFRYGLFIADRSRIVLDLAEPALIERADSVAVDGRHRLILRLARVERSKFSAAARRDMARKSQAPTETGALPAPVAQDASQLPLVVIDPGHGGIDPGASSADGETEKSIVLALSLAVKERLEAVGKVRVAMTRNDDSFVPLNDRVKFARDRKAALMVSLHADALAYEPGVRGATIYTVSEKASDVLSAKLADSENNADQIAGIESNEDVGAIGDILFDLTKRETRHFSTNLARHLGETMPKSTSMHKNPLRFAGFRVLTAPDVPSVLIEAGYLSSAEDAKLMRSAEWRDGMARSIATAVEKFVGENATRVLNSAAKP